MKKILLSTLLLIMAIGTMAQNGVKNVTVSTADEFIKAIASNTNITLKVNGTLDITSALDKLDKSRDISDKEIDNYPNLPAGVYYSPEYDGNSIVILNIKNLTITGDAKRTHIQAKPSYSNVLLFNNCENITIKNIKAGHVEAGSCVGDVISFEKSNNIKIDNCDLYGCGVNGISLFETENATVTNTEIRECNENMVVMHECYGVTFTKCYMHDCGTAIDNWRSTGIAYNDCRIIGEDGSDLYDFYKENADFVDDYEGDVDDEYYEDEDERAFLLECVDAAYDQFKDMLGEEFVNGVVIEDFGDESGMVVFPEQKQKFAAAIAQYDEDAVSFKFVFVDAIDAAKGEKMFFGNGHIIVVKKEGIFSYEIEDSKVASVTVVTGTQNNVNYQHGKTKNSLKKCTKAEADPHLEFEAINIEKAKETDEEYPWG